MFNDNVITREIRAMLERDERLPHPAEVAVSERHGTVTLRGSVGSFRQRRAAVKIARSVHGVIAVADELWVDPRDRWEDNEIRGAALQALTNQASAERIDVTVANAWLTLKREVKHQTRATLRSRRFPQSPASAESPTRSRWSSQGSGSDLHRRPIIWNA